MSESTRTRTMQESDVERVAEIHVASWRVAYQGIVRRSRMDSLSVATAIGAWRKRLEAAHTNHIVCEWEGELVGFASYGPVRPGQGGTAEPGVAEIFALYVHPELWGRGCGRALVDEVKEHLQGQWEQLVLLTLEDNAAARAFYVELGFREVRNSSRPRADQGADVVLYRLSPVSEA